MNLGSSMRRRRGSAGGQWSMPELRGPGGGGRSALFATLVLVAGLFVGYLYATQVVFPIPELQAEEFRTVPDLRGLDAPAAVDLLWDHGLQLGEVDSIRHPRVEEGKIVGQTPLPGQLAVSGGEVEIAVSTGPDRRPVPDVSRLVASRAELVLGSTGFEVEVDSVEADVPAGRVVETFPPAGELAEIPSRVRIAVSLGPPLVEVPDLVGMQEEQARAVLESLGLEVGEVQERQRFGFSRGQVLEQIPAAGEEVPRGGEVHLVVGMRGIPGGDPSGGEIP